MKHGQIGEKVIKMIFISFGVVALLSIIATTFSIFQKNAPEILDNCVVKPVLVSKESASILSRDDAVTFLEKRINGPFAFTQNTVDACDPSKIGYVYEAQSDNISYVLCEDGAFYRYERICTEGGRAKSLVSMLIKDKNAAQNK